MGSSWRIGQWFGIQVRLHITFLLLLLFVMMNAWGDSGSVLSVGLNLLLVASLFGFVVLHEYGHALMARRFGIHTREITLYPIGGVAMLERMPESPRQQMLIALAGPAVNFAVALLLAVLMLLGGVPFGDGESLLSEVGSVLLAANLTMGLFNLIPALPMDGGRVLRAFLQLRTSPWQATRWSARIARAIAVLMGLYALWPPTQMMLLFIAGFVWMAAGAEERAARRAHYMRSGVVGNWRRAVPHAYGAAPPEEEPAPAAGEGPVRARAYVTDAYRTPDPEASPFSRWQHRSEPEVIRASARPGSGRPRFALRLEPGPHGGLRFRLVRV